MSRARGRLYAAAWTAVALITWVGCGVASQTTIDAPGPATRADVLRLEDEALLAEEQLMASLSAATASEPDCVSACELLGTICDLAGRICVLTARHPDLAGRCGDAKSRCEDAREQTAARCTCPGPLPSRRTDG